MTQNTINPMWLVESGSFVSESDPTTWIKLTPAGSPPSRRITASAVYDDSQNTLTIFGGHAGSSNLNDSWVLTNADESSGTPTWTELTPSNPLPSPRAGHTAVYDPSSNRMIIFGGLGGFTVFNDTWVLEHANGFGGTPTWIQLNPTGGPPHERRSHTAVYNTTTNRMIIFGGFFDSAALGGGTNLNDVWVLTNANGLGGTPTWVTPNVLNNLFGPGDPLGDEGLSQHTAIYDETTDTMLVFSGQILAGPNAGLQNRTWQLANASAQTGTPAWSERIPANGSFPPVFTPVSSAVYAQDTNRMIVFGLDGLSAFNDVWVLTGAVP